jgi:RNase P subunit RPR2
MKEIKIEKASSGRSSCKNCEALIPEGQMRAKVREEGYPYPKNYVLCRECGKFAIDAMVKDLTDKRILLL